MRAGVRGHRGNVLLRRSAATPGHADVPAALIDLIGAVGAESGHGSRRTRSWACRAPWTTKPGGCCGHRTFRSAGPNCCPATSCPTRLGLPAHVANDADLAAVGEAAFGAGAGITDVAYLTISTGIGAGVVHDGHLLRGRRSLAEVGHTVIDWRAWREGSPCTLEELGSGSGLARLALEAGLGLLDAREVESAAASGEARAITIWHGAIAACAVGVSNLVMSFYPSIVVIGGGLGRGAEFFGPLRDLVMSRPEHHPADLTIVPTALGDDAGLAGAAPGQRQPGRPDPPASHR